MDLPKGSILLVDDEQDLRDLLRDFLNHSFPNYQVMEASDGVEAIAILNQQKFKLIICDLKMPKATGMEVMKHLTNNIPESNRPESVIVLSGFLSDSQCQKLNSGPVKFMLKPFNQDELKAYLKTIL